MVEGIEIEGFRGITKGSVSGFRQFNVLIGPNNVGKSAVMQAFPFAFEKGQFADWLGTRLGLFKGAVRRDALFGPQTTIKLKNNTGGGVEASFSRGNGHPTTLFVGGGGGNNWGFNDLDGSTRWSYPSYWTDTAFAFLPSDPDLFGQPRRFEDLISSVIVSGGRGKLISLLKPLLPDIQDVRILTVRGEPTLYIEETGDRVWPAASMGDGVKRLMGLAAFMSLNAGYRFIEEPEAHHHAGSARQVARLLWDSLEDDKQVFVSTHSLPLVEELLDNAEGREAKMRVLLLARDGGVVTAKSYSAEQVRAKEARRVIQQALDPRYPG